jgi:hypothetical protein
MRVRVKKAGIDMVAAQTTCARRDKAMWLRDWRLGVALFALAIGVALTSGMARAADEPFAISIVARDGIYTPPNLEVPAGVRIKIMIRNEGKEPMEFESLPLKIEKVLAPGASSSVVINKLKPGQYPFWDEFHPDTSKGFIVAK